MKKRIKRTGNFCVYILECADGTYYAGYTTDLEKRIKEHDDGKGRGAKYLRGKVPVELVWRKEYRYYKSAVKEERRIKGLTRKQKEKLVHGKH